MRFDDMLPTVLAQPDAHPRARAAKWRQLVDLLAQPGTRDVAQVEEALEFLRNHRDEVDLTSRISIARTLTGRRVSPLLLRLFAEDHPSVAAPIVGTARLSSDDWIALLPRLGPTARALVRHRTDLDPEVTKFLAAFGPVDMVLAGSPDAEAQNAQTSSMTGPSASGDPQIRELVARIEAFRRSRSENSLDASDTPVSPIETFRWESGPDGVILWVEGAPRGPVIGQSIAGPATRGDFGVDGQAAGAFRKRTPFRDARFTIAGAGAAAGEWRISGVPFFDSRLGSFLGYRGNARRPRVDEIAPATAGVQAGLFGSQLPADSLRQLVHELRTPLNAIFGFAEMIDGQYLGPASNSYRERARDIMDQAGRLLAAVDDLDTAARIETQRLILEDSDVDAVELLSKLADTYRSAAEQNRTNIRVESAEFLPRVRVEPSVAERMVARLLGATIGLASAGEEIRASLDTSVWQNRPMARLSLDRPSAIAGKPESALLDPGYSPEGDWPAAPALGLGFALRLVRNLAEAAGGFLVLDDERFHLYLPLNGQTEQSRLQGE